MSTQIFYEEGRVRQLEALAATVERLAGTSASLQGAREVALIGIGASFAALATPLHTLRSGGVKAWRSDCSDLPAVPLEAPERVVAVSQGGRSVETHDVVRRLTDAGARTLAITNAEGSPLGDAAGDALTLGGAADSRVSTVGFFTTYSALAILAERAVGVTAETDWAELPRIIRDAVAEATPTLKAYAAEQLTAGAVDVVASAAQLTVAEAVALLFREGPLVPASAYGTRAYLHGPMDVAGHGTSHIVVGGAREQQLADQLEENTAATLFLAGRESLRAGHPYEVPVPAGLTEGQRALVSVAILQQLVSETAAVRGNPVDDAVFVRQDTKLAPRT
ncbi:SIS domain-containing protein [Microbacterium tumbae]